MPPTQRTITIQAKQGWLHFNWKSLWEYRDLLLLLVRRDFVSKYKQTILGPLWFIIQPILMTLLFTFIFGRVAKIPTDGAPHILFYLCGLMSWNYFAQSFSSISGSFLANAHIYQKVYFPRLIVPLSSIISNVFPLLLQLITFLAFFTYYKLSGRWENAPGNTGTALALYPLILIQTAALGLGTGLWMSALTAKYRDLSHLSQFIIQVWMYATPIIFPLSAVPEKFQWLLILNPMTAIVESTKHLFLGSGGIPTASHGISLFITLTLLISGVLLYQRVERTFVDTL